MDIIINNPYRYLGVYSNSPTKERVANKGKMNAFLKVGKSVSFPLDIPSLLPAIERSVETVAHAESELTLPMDQIRFAQFWWMNTTPLDKIAFNHLTSGNVEMAKTIWDKKNNVSSLQNRFVLSVINNDLNGAIEFAESLYAGFSDEFISSVAGDNMAVSTPLWQMLINSLVNEKVDILPFIDILENEEWKNYISEKTILPLIDELSHAIDSAKSSRGNGPESRLKAGQKLMSSTKSTLSQLRKCLNKSDIRYQTIVDKLATEILQCGIDYFNETDDDDAPQKASLLQEYALTIAIGRMVKDRCKENVDILKKIGIEYSVRKELKQLTVLIKKLRNEDVGKPLFRLLILDRSISDVSRIVEQSLPLLDSMKNKLGYSNPLYMNVSSAVASSAINALVEIVNLQQSLIVGDDNRLKEVILEAISLMSTIGRLDMDSKTRNYYTGNKSTLDSIYNKLCPSGACYIATMAYGDYNHPQVIVLRGFRDDYLAHRTWGRLFIKEYYKYSPRLVEKLNGRNWINNVIRKILDKFVEHLKENKQ